MSQVKAIRLKQKPQHTPSGRNFTVSFEEEKNKIWGVSGSDSQQDRTYRYLEGNITRQVTLIVYFTKICGLDNPEGEKNVSLIRHGGHRSAAAFWYTSEGGQRTVGFNEQTEQNRGLSWRLLSRFWSGVRWTPVFVAPPLSLDEADKTRWSIPFVWLGFSVEIGYSEAKARNITHPVCRYPSWRW